MLIPVLVVYTGDIRVVTMIARGGGGAAAAQGNVSASVDTVTPAAKGTSWMELLCSTRMAPQYVGTTDNSHFSDDVFGTKINGKT